MTPRDYTVPSKPRTPVTFHITRQAVGGEDTIVVRTGHHDRKHFTLGEARSLHGQLGEILAADGTVEEPLPSGAELEAE